MNIPPNLLDATVQHLVLTYSALAIAIAIALPLSLAALYSRRAALAVMTGANLLQAIPSFAVVAIVVPFLGIGFVPAVIAIMIRALLPIIKNAYLGLRDVDASLIDSAKGIGLTEWQITRHIRLPHAYPPLFAGMKFAAILANSIAILTAIIGSGGLGSIIFQGLSNLNTDKILAGSLPTIGIALFIDASFSLLERAVTPRTASPERNIKKR
ncbi:MAG: ABC transporter permease [Candidatus Methanofastidiosa archaeon]|nr:ABC transporter permease [Candidatus Methanofastidiosa archaeon]